jgi:hypothetical protein
MRIDQRKKWYQKIKYNKNFKVVSFITVILVFVVGYMIITGRDGAGDNASNPGADGSNSLETIVIQAPDDPTEDLMRYASSDMNDNGDSGNGGDGNNGNNGNNGIEEFDYTIQGAGTIAAPEPEKKKDVYSYSGSDRTSGGSGDGGASVLITGMENSVRVILTNGGDYYQSYVEFSCSTDVNVTSDGKAKEYKAGDMVSLGSDVKASRIVVEPEHLESPVSTACLISSSV